MSVQSAVLPARCKYQTVGYVAAGPAERERVGCLRSFYGVVNLADAQDSAVDLLVVVGGDGFMLHSLHNYVVGPGRNVPVYGVRHGSVGFLLNHCVDGSLPHKLENAVATELPLLRMEAKDVYGHTHSAIAVNEVSLFRGTHQAAKLRIKINGKVAMEELVSDGVIVSSPAGSTAYNFSAGGPILPFTSNIVCLTAINSFRPRRWRGALLPNDSLVEIDVLSPETRCVSAVADYTEFRNISDVKIKQDNNTKITLMFDPEHGLEERTIAEQFLA
ncbi:inorganic polyphosphate/ATP-NAD kinase [Anaplasma centrale str. Israel]|uniref:NAD kinase n=1 Tax=Anaplasma centrale (strain Israel) TaxID=574556 RepID=D1AT20_ANACI|nr:NAD kinase [Anaplasma centrale]ACZ49623.1 inorganic polyphosphate/ATP-NAD kinase [Anaplasma centrale str. Israel]